MRIAYANVHIEYHIIKLDIMCCMRNSDMILKVLKINNHFQTNVNKEQLINEL